MSSDKTQKRKSLSKLSIKGSKERRAKKAMSGADAIEAEKFINGSETETQKDTVELASNTILDIPLEQIEPNHFNARTFYREEVIQERAESLAREGQLVPAIVVREGDKFKLIDGHYRFKAAESINLPTLRCELLKDGLSGFEYFEASYAANMERKNQIILDSAVRWKQMTDEEGMTQETLMGIVKRSKGEVSKICNIGSLPMGILEHLAQKKTPVGVHAGYAIYQVFKKIGDTEELHSLVSKVVENDLNKQDVEKLRDDALGESRNVEKKPKAAPKHQFTDPKGKVKGNLDYKGKRINMKFEAPSAEKAEEIAQAIAKILEGVHGEG